MEVVTLPAEPVADPEAVGVAVPEAVPETIETAWPALSQALAKALRAAFVLDPHIDSMAAWTAADSDPHRVDKSEGMVCVWELIAPMRHAGLAATATCADATKAARKMVAFAKYMAAENQTIRKEGNSSVEKLVTLKGTWCSQVDCWKQVAEERLQSRY